MVTNPLLQCSFFDFQQTLTEELGLEAFRAKQVWEWIFLKQVFSFAEMTNLSKATREKLQERFPKILPPILDRQKADDGTFKLAIGLDEATVVEAVGLPSEGEEGEEDTLTFCLSTQCGCGVGCRFCRTGSSGLLRNLSPEEIVLQVLMLMRAAKRKPTNIVFMGMGEPFLNRKALFTAIDILTHQSGLAMATRRLTISTVGIPQGILDLADRPGEVNLAISLHAADNDTRSRLIPINRQHPLEKIHKAVVEYIERTKRRVTFEVALLDQINDQLDHMLNLIQFCEGLLCHVNLIPFNPYPGSEFKPSKKDTEREFKKALKKAGIPVTVRRSRGASIMAACGQLAGK